MPGKTLANASRWIQGSLRGPIGPCWLGVLLAAVLADGAHADLIRLKRGDVLVGRVVQHEASVVVIEHELFGRLEVPWDELDTVQIGINDPALVEPGAPAEESVATAEDVDAVETSAETATPPPPEKPAKPWTLNIDATVNSTTGNTDEQFIRLAAGFNRKTDRSRLAIDTSLYYKQSDSVTTDNAFTIGVEHDWLLPKVPWFYFVQGRFDADQFESWNRRVNAHGGVGYHLVELDDFDLSLCAGLGGRKEFGSLNDDFRSEALLGLNATWRITEKQSLEASGRLFPVIEDRDDFRSRSTLDYRYLVSEEFGLSLSFGLRHEYQSIVDPGKDRNDLRMFAGVRMDF